VAVQLEAHLLQPLILSRAVRLHPLAIVLSVASGALMGGVGGALLAVPLVAVVNTIVPALPLRPNDREDSLTVVRT
jgi:putative heme transporter